MKYGIQILPVTPGSVYLESFSDSNFGKHKKGYQRDGGSETKPWGDLFVTWRSFYETDDVFKNIYLKKQNT